MAGFRPRQPIMKQGLSPGQKTTLNKGASTILDPSSVLQAAQSAAQPGAVAQQTMQAPMDAQMPDNLGTSPQLQPGLTNGQPYSGPMARPQQPGQAPRPQAPAFGPVTPQAMMQLWGQTKTAMYGDQAPQGNRTAVPYQEAPSVPDPAIEQQARRSGQLADLVHGFTGTIPLTSYSAKLGQTPGMVADSPAWQAVRSQGQNPWVEEQRRVHNANIMHSFNNQYSKMKTDSDNTDNQRAFEMSQGFAATQGAIGMFGQQRQLAEESLDVEREKAKAINALAGRRMDQGDARLEQADARLKLAQENADKGYLPGGGDSITYNMAKTVRPMIERLRDLIQQDGALNPTHGSWTWGQYRASSDTRSQDIKSLKDGIHQYLIQLDKRQMRGIGYTMYGEMLPHFGNDDVQVDVSNLNRLHGFLGGLQDDLSRRYTNPRTGVNNFEPNAGQNDTSGPPGGGGAPGNGGEADIEQEIIKRGWR